MKAIPQEGYPMALVVVTMSEKETLSITLDGSKVGIPWFPSASQDGRMAQPTSGVLIDSVSGKIKNGSYVIFHHNATSSTFMVEENIEREKQSSIYMFQNGYKSKNIYAIREDAIFCVCDGVPQSPDDIVPLYPTCLVERVYDEVVEKNGIVLSRYPIKVEDKARVIKAPANDEGIKDGDMLLIHKMSDYELNYSIEGYFSTLIKVNIDIDVLAIL